MHAPKPPEFKQLSIFDVIEKREAQEKAGKALEDALPTIPDIAKSVLRIAERCRPNEVHLILMRGNAIPLLAVSRAMYALGIRKPRRILVPVTEVGTYEKGELEKIIRKSLDHLPRGSLIHYIDECETGANSAAISRVLKKLSVEKGHEVTIDLIVHAAGRRLMEPMNKSYYRYLKEAGARFHPVEKIPWMDYPAVSGYKWAKDFLKCVSDLSVVGVKKKDEKKIRRVFNAVMWKRHAWVREMAEKRLKIIRFDSEAYRRRPLDVLKGLYAAFRETGLHEKYGVRFERKAGAITIGGRRVHHTELMNKSVLFGPAGMLVDPRPGQYRIEKYTLLRLGYPIANAAVEFRKKLFEEIRRQVEEKKKPGASTPPPSPAPS